MTKTNVQSTLSNSQHHDTPNSKTHVIKFRVTAEEKTSLELTCKLLNAGLSNIMLETILGYFDRSPEIPNGLAYLNSAIGYMLYGWVHEWMCRGMQESGTELARMLAEAQKK